MITFSTVAQNNDLSILNDDFNQSNSLSNWETHHQNEGWPAFTEKQEVIENESVFYIQPETSGWYGEYHRSPFYYKNVSGNFTVVTRLKVTGKETLSPTRAYSLAGLMIRTPRPEGVDKNAKGHENWMFLSTGSATKNGKPQFESKNTVKGKSKLKVFPAKQGWIYLAISRVDNTFYQSYRYEGEHTWYLMRVVHRNDMADTVQVGMLAYTDFWSLWNYFITGNRKKFNTQYVEGKPDLIARFDYMQFNRIATSPLSGYEKEGYYNTQLSAEAIKQLQLK